MTKPVVRYVRTETHSGYGIHQYFDMPDPKWRVAYIGEVLDHPRLGHCFDVRTSTVESVSDDGVIETRNTIYKPVMKGERA